MQVGLFEVFRALSGCSAVAGLHIVLLGTRVASGNTKKYMPTGTCYD